jgi:dolichol-phosphate mannosyltransferase
MNVLVILPTYNERENLPHLARDVLAHGYRLMIVDDQSPDGTGAIADELAREFPGRVEVVHRTGRRGLGRSYVEGMSKAIRTDVDLICQMDADFSHDPKYLPDMIAAAERHDMVIGSRYLNGISVVNWPLHRLVLSVLANRYIRFAIRVRVHDCTSGFRCWRRETLAGIPLERIVSEGYAFIVETLYEASRRGARIGEVPIIFVERRHGTSKLSKSVLLESLITPWRIRVRGMLQKPSSAPRALQKS